MSLLIKQPTKDQNTFYYLYLCISHYLLQRKKKQESDLPLCILPFSRLLIQLPKIDASKPKGRMDGEKGRGLGGGGVNGCMGAGISFHLAIIAFVNSHQNKP